MVALTGPAVDPTLGAPARCYVSAGGTITPALIDPPPDPGDPDLEFDEATAAPVIQLEIGRALTRTPVGFLTTAEVEDWCDDVEILAGYAATATASSFDPLWAELAESTTMGTDGRPIYEWDPKGYMAWLYRDGRPIATFIFLSPIDIGGGRVALAMVGPQEQWNYRILGHGEQPDLLGDRGSFEVYGSVADMLADGWTFDAGVTASLVTDGVRGTKALSLTGDGWAHSPKVTVDGASGYSRVIDGQAFGKWSSGVADREMVALARTSLAGAEYDTAYTVESAAARPDGSGWTDDPLSFAARLAPVASSQRAWLDLRSFDGETSRYDLAQLRLSYQTGFPPGTDRDLSYYVERIHRDSVARSLGGYPDGLRTRIRALTGTEASMRWAHATRTTLRDVYAQVLEMDGAPECRITVGWWLEVWDALGSERDDITLSAHDIIRSGWSTDPGARVDRFLVDSGRGVGVTALFAVYESDAETGWRVDAVVQGPAARPFNDLGAWATAHGRTAAKPQVTADVMVPWWVADLIVTGDVVRVVAEDGASGFSRRMRVLRRRYIATGSMLCALTLGVM